MFEKRTESKVFQNGSHWGRCCGELAPKHLPKQNDPAQKAGSFSGSKTCSGQKSLHLFLNYVLRHITDDLVSHLAVLEEEQRWDPANAIAHRRSPI
jgi:hypothetical protein